MFSSCVLRGYRIHFTISAHLHNLYNYYPEFHADQACFHGKASLEKIIWDSVQIFSNCSLYSIGPRSLRPRSLGPSSPQNRAEITTEQAEITTKQAEFTQAEIAKGRDHHDPHVMIHGSCPWPCPWHAAKPNTIGNTDHGHGMLWLQWLIIYCVVTCWCTEPPTPK